MGRGWYTRPIGAWPMTSTTRFTSKDLEAFPDNEWYRYEIIDGELHVTKAPNWEHNHTVLNIVLAVGLWDREAGLGELNPNPGVIFAQDDDVIPDLVWVSHERLRRLLQPD